MKSITIHTLIIITCLSLILAACQPLQKLAAEPVGGSISALPGSPASICNKSSGSVWVSLIDTSTNVSIPTTIQVQAGECTRTDTQDVRGLWGKRCKSGGLNCSYQLWNMQGGSAEIVDGYVTPEVPGRILYILQQKVTGRWETNPDVLGFPYPDSLSGIGYGFAKAAPDVASWTIIANAMKDDELDSIMKLTSFAMDGTSCVTDLAILFSTLIVPPEMSIHCSQAAVGLNDVLTKYQKPTINRYTNLVAQHSNQCLSILNGDTGWGAQVVQAECNGGTEQEWSVAPYGDGFILLARHSGMCLDLSGGKTANGTGIIQWGCSSTPNQTWMVTPSNGGYRISPTLDSRYCLDISGASRDAGAPVILWECNNGSNQLFQARNP